MFVGLGAIVLVAGCDTYEQQNEFTERAFGEQPAGYTPTDENGNVTDSTELDDDDWRTAPAYSGVIVEPAYPNPLSEGVGHISITVPFLESVDGRLVLCAFGPHSQLRTIDSLPETTGTQVLIIQPGHVRRTGLVRFFIMDSVTTECSTAREVISYGDVMIE